MAEFGEQVFGKLALKRPATERKVKRGKKKLFEKIVQSTWLGIHARTGEHVIALPSGEAIRVRTIHRLSGDARWSPEAVPAIRALPRRPVPQRDDADPESRAAGQECRAESGQETDVGGSKLDRPQVAEGQKVP